MIYELDPDILKICRHTNNEVFRSRLSKLKPSWTGKADRHTKKKKKKFIYEIIMQQ